jgi:hypothetical protein
LTVTLENILITPTLTPTLIFLGVVDWKKVVLPPKSLYQNIENVNYAISTVSRMDVVVVNIGWLDIVGGDRKFILGILAQLMKQYPIPNPNPIDLKNERDIEIIGGGRV